ncbi:efflux transporter periplasmic adaptor subunit [Photobacterium jeanii]|uniref:Efflux transporter periplasmic adaptor subunit n=1 Tax=Photobacterium jeanii TaxID=858640 RepID=A0A178K2V0_9GAMM|nr:efflux RND transporter periplasmic adaptor subunit [Photobacterium jeanii]OAN11639.1 efflux transporter periplasmic adaptor subunit [Photobacterium jeanii]PST91161.1 efflux RND transporter periplasmic adaptor subunit [Photobacterium jeanii]
MKKRWISGAIAVALAAGGYFYWQPSADDANMTQPVLTVAKGSIEKTAIAVGKIVPAHSVQIKSQLEGIVEEIYHHTGEQVEAGTALFKIKPNPTPQKLTQATTDVTTSQARLESALQKFENLEGLVKNKVIPSNYSDYIQAKADLRQAKADLRQKQQNLDLIQSGESSVGKSKLSSTIYAPISGTVLNVLVEVGEPIISTESNQAATVMMSMANMEDIIFKGSVSEHDAAQLSPGMAANLTMAPYPDVVVNAKLNKVAVQSEKLNASNGQTASGNFDNGFQIEINKIHFPDDLTVRSGFSATAKITLKAVNDVPTIPERALQFEGSNPSVLIPDESEAGFHPQPVKLGLSDGINVQVLEGVEQGQEILDASMMMGVPNA